MINQDFAEFPEHRVGFFKLLRAINLYCFPGMEERHIFPLMSADKYSLKHCLEYLRLSSNYSWIVSFGLSNIQCVTLRILGLTVRRIPHFLSYVWLTYSTIFSLPRGRKQFCKCCRPCYHQRVLPAVLPQYGPGYILCPDGCRPQERLQAPKCLACPPVSACRT